MGILGIACPNLGHWLGLTWWPFSTGESKLMPTNNVHANRKKAMQLLLLLRGCLLTCKVLQLHPHCLVQCPFIALIKRHIGFSVCFFASFFYIFSVFHCFHTTQLNIMFPITELIVRGPQLAWPALPCSVGRRKTLAGPYLALLICYKGQVESY